MRSTLTNLLKRRDLLAALVSAELRASSAGMRLGSLWWVLDPILMMLVYWLVLDVLLGRGREAYQPFPVFLLVGLVVFKHVASGIERSITVLRTKEALIKAAAFPTMVLPVAAVLTGLVHFLFGLVIVVVVSLFWRGEQHSGSYAALLQLVPLVAFQTMLVVGLAMAISAIGVVVQDLRAVTTHVMRVAFWLSPCLYGLDLVREVAEARLGDAAGPVLATYLALNPIAVLNTAYREAIFYGQGVPLWAWGTLAAQAGVCLLAGIAIYQHHDRRIIKLL